MMRDRWIPQWDRFLIVRKRYDDKVAEGGIIVQPGKSVDAESQNLLTQARIEEIPVGPGWLCDSKGLVCHGKDGEPIGHNFNVGDLVLVSRFCGYYIEMPCKDHGGIALVQAGDILAVYERSEPLIEEVPASIVVPGMVPS